MALAGVRRIWLLPMRLGKGRSPVHGDAPGGRGHVGLPRSVRNLDQALRTRVGHRRAYDQPHGAVVIPGGADSLDQVV